MKRIEIEGIEIHIEHKPHNKNSYIRIEPDGSVHLKTPMRLMWRIQKLLRTKIIWIQAKRALALRREHHEYGKTIMLEGVIMPVEALGTLHQAILRLQEHDHNALKRCYSRFYLNQSKATIPLHVSELSHQTSLYPTVVRFRKMKRQWGNCNHKGIITFNTTLMMLPVHLQRYVVLHELCHLRHMNHSRDFYTLLYHYMPEAPQYERELKALHVSY